MNSLVTDSNSLIGIIGILVGIISLISGSKIISDKITIPSWVVPTLIIAFSLIFLMQPQHQALLTYIIIGGIVYAIFWSKK